MESLRAPQAVEWETSDLWMGRWRWKQYCFVQLWLYLMPQRQHTSAAVRRVDWAVKPTSPLATTPLVRPAMRHALLIVPHCYEQTGCASTTDFERSVISPGPLHIPAVPEDRAGPLLATPISAVFFPPSFDQYGYGSPPQSEQGGLPYCPEILRDSPRMSPTVPNAVPAVSQLGHSIPAELPAVDGEEAPRES
ncbi:hypothetical protein MMC08_004377 [Hypocenomyce scalaris]|nr:hypothetical protein [Hypocenomyce scalaris]